MQNLNYELYQLFVKSYRILSSAVVVTSTLRKMIGVNRNTVFHFQYLHIDLSIKSEAQTTCARTLKSAIVPRFIQITSLMCRIVITYTLFFNFPYYGFDLYYGTLDGLLAVFLYFTILLKHKSTSSTEF